MYFIREYAAEAGRFVTMNLPKKGWGLFQATGVFQPLGWVEHRDTHQSQFAKMMGYATTTVSGLFGQHLDFRAHPAQSSLELSDAHHSLRS